MTQTTLLRTSKPTLTPKLHKLIITKTKLKETIKCGLGRCLADNCNCKAFEGSYDTCKNCGHNKDRHW